MTGTLEMAALDNRVCAGCPAVLVRRPVESSTYWAKRKFCGTSCFTAWQARTSKRGSGRFGARSEPRQRPDMSWARGAVCAGQAPAFDGDEVPNPARWAELGRLVLANCCTCPVVERCAATADEHELVGLWAGRYRFLKHGHYLAIGFHERPAVTA